jgi:hypothetical protein
MVKDFTLIQWGRVYLIESVSQGYLLKRLYEADEYPHKFKCISDSPEFPVFYLPRTDIKRLSLVLGGVVFE